MFSDVRLYQALMPGQLLPAVTVSSPSVWGSRAVHMQETERSTVDQKKKEKKENYLLKIKAVSIMHQTSKNFNRIFIFFLSLKNK